MEILWENADMVVLCKQPGQNSESGPGSVPETLRSLWAKPEAYVGVVHRLDTATGGVMVYAKNPKTAAIMSEQIRDDQLKKQYLCICAGIPEPKTGDMEDFLFKDSRSNKVYPVKGERKGSRKARLSYEVLSTGNISETEVSLCRVFLHTGRTHQVRVQFASRRHPLLGDGKYGSRIKGPMALFCESLTFCVPGEGRKTFTAQPEGNPFFDLMMKSKENN